MKSVVFIMLFFTLNGLYSQDNNQLQGKWICDKITYIDNTPIEINHPLYSSYLSYEFVGNKVFISTKYYEKGLSNELNILGNKLKIGFRTLLYKIENNTLILQEDGDELKFHFLKEEDFINKYDFVDEKYKIISGDTLYFRSFTNNPIFNNTLSFSNYMRKNMKTYSDYVSKRGIFKASFVLTKENKIDTVYVQESLNKRFDKDFINTLISSERFWINKTGKDILIDHSFYFFEMGKAYITKEERQFNKYYKEGKDFYKINDFENSILSFKKCLDIDENELKHIVFDKNDLLIKLGISYLAINQFEEACNSFYALGDRYNFNIRNYILNFCQY
jgi:hypothetical protein